MIPLELSPDRLFPADPGARSVARTLYQAVRDLPIVSPHGHTDPSWYANDTPFEDPAALFIVPDHYVYRMLYSQGVPLDALGVPPRDGTRGIDNDPRAIWRIFAQHYPLFRGTPTRLWLDHAFHTVFGIDERLTEESADRYYDRIAACLRDESYRPRALFERFDIEVIATTESPLDPLAHHRAIRESGWRGRVITAYRPDPVVDPQFDGFAATLGRCDGPFTRYGFPAARHTPPARIACQSLLDIVTIDDAWRNQRGHVVSSPVAGRRVSSRQPVPLGSR